MSASRTEALQKAFELLESNQDAAALELLEPLLRQYPDDADAWWIYSHAVTSPVEARRALGNVLRIDPNYPEAAELMRQLEIENPDVVPAAPDLPEVPEVNAASVVDEEPEFLSETPSARPVVPSAAAYPEPTPQRSRFPWWIAAVVAIVALVIVVLLLTRPSEDGTQVASATDAPTAAPTTEVIAETTPEEQVVLPVDPTNEPEAVVTDAVVPEEPTVQAEVVATDTAPVVEPTADAPVAPTLELIVEPTTEQVVETDATLAVVVEPLPTVTTLSAENPLEAVQSTLAGAGLADFTVAGAQTSAGNAYQVTVCSAEGVELRNVLLTSMVALASATPVIPADVTAISTRIVSCTDSSQVLRVIVASRADAEAFIRGELTQEQFAAFWLSQ